uniref:Uncharacterized protein n=1 Tax=Anguilla anguilla TaxID=7936 RepID=A0A0E9VJW5_ANGAN
MLKVISSQSLLFLKFNRSEK